jgi:hypothetical protein
MPPPSESSSVTLRTKIAVEILNSLTCNGEEYVFWRVVTSARWPTSPSNVEASILPQLQDHVQSRNLTKISQLSLSYLLEINETKNFLLQWPIKKFISYWSLISICHARTIPHTVDLFTFLYIHCCIWVVRVRRKSWINVFHNITYHILLLLRERQNKSLSFMLM